MSLLRSSRFYASQEIEDEVDLLSEAFLVYKKPERPEDLQPLLHLPEFEMAAAGDLSSDYDSQSPQKRVCIGPRRRNWSGPPAPNPGMSPSASSHRLSFPGYAYSAARIELRLPERQSCSQSVAKQLPGPRLPQGRTATSKGAHEQAGTREEVRSSR